MNQPANYPLRLPQSLKDAIAQAAARDGISINQFIVLAAAEKLAALDTVRFFEERANRADLARFRQILNRPGGEPPRPGDELPG
jgi:uncharacterized protein (DUF1778 family)